MTTARNFFLILLFAIATALGFSRAAVAVDTGSVTRDQSRNYFGARGDLRFDIRFHDTNLGDALQFLASIADANVIMPPGIQGVVNTSFRDIRLGDAINSIIKANGLDYTLEGGVIRVGKGEIFKDAGEDLRTETLRLNFATAHDTVPQVRSLLSSRGTVFGDDRTNAITVREVPANIDNVRRFVEEVDIRDAQVLIEAKILEATRSFSRDLGIQWGVNKPGGRWDVRGLSDVGTAQSHDNLNVNLPATTPTSGIGLLIGRLKAGTQIDIQLSAAESRGDVYIISDPSIVTSNGTAAKIRSGATLLINASGNVNIGSSGSGGTTSGSAGLQKIETGVELKVTPQISVNDFVKLDISAITSSPDFSRSIQGIPVIVDNTATTTVLVHDGETTVIGGLTRFSDTQRERRVPGLSRIPLFGNLFKSKSKAKENTELMVFIKPSIVRSEGVAPAQMRVRELEDRREAMTLEPLSNPQQDRERAAIKARRQRLRGGNKYERMKNQ